MPGEFELAGMLFHQLLEASERHNLPERHMHSLCTGLGTEDSCSLINETFIKPYRCHCYNHNRSSHMFLVTH